MSRRGLRGSELENWINYTLDVYKNSSLCLIQKIPTPIKPIKLSDDHSQITLAFFEKKSTVDYIGAVQGIPVCFDVKECSRDLFSLYNIHNHQYEFMKNMESQNGISFIIIYFSHRDIFYYLRYSQLSSFIEKKDLIGKKSFKLEELDKEFFFREKNSIIPFLDLLKQDIEMR